MDFQDQYADRHWLRTGNYRGLQMTVTTVLCSGALFGAETAGGETGATARAVTAICNPQQNSNSRPVLAIQTSMRNTIDPIAARRKGSVDPETGYCGSRGSYL